MCEISIFETPPTQQLEFHQNKRGIGELSFRSEVKAVKVPGQSVTPWMILRKLGTMPGRINSKAR